MDAGPGGRLLIPAGIGSQQRWGEMGPGKSDRLHCVCTSPSSPWSVSKEADLSTRWPSESSQCSRGGSGEPGVPQRPTSRGRLLGGAALPGAEGSTEGGTFSPLQRCLPQAVIAFLQAFWITRGFLRVCVAARTVCDSEPRGVLLSQAFQQTRPLQVAGS